jgi:hypothetical protein
MENRGGALLGLILAAVLSAPGIARAEKTGDKATERTAVEDFAAGRYDQSLELFAKLYADTLNPVYLRNIGRCQQKLRHPDKAIDAFKDYLAKGKKISADERAEINGYIKEMEDLRDKQAKDQQAAAVPATPPPVQPLPSDQAPYAPYAPGATGAYPGGSPAFAPGQPPPAGAVVAQPVPAPAAESPPFYTRWWFWTVVGAVVAGGVVTAVVLSSGTDKPACSAPGLTGLVCR